MTNNQKAIDLVRQFATHQSTGLRGVVRIKRLQEEAVALLKKMGKLEEPREQAAPVTNPYLTIALNDYRHRERDMLQTMFLNQWAEGTGKVTLLAAETCITYDRRCDEVEYKTDHGGLAWSRSPLDIRREVVDAVYPEAVNLGFEGKLQDWVQFVWDRRAPETKEPRG